MNSPSLAIRSRLLAVHLPALPQVLMKLMHVCASEDAGMDTLAELVSQDAALAAKVLQVASSAAYHQGPHRASIHQALATIGLDMVRTLLVTQSVYQTFHEVGAGLDLRAFWRHAITSALTAQTLARAQDYPAPEEAYLAGLLHDIGRLGLAVAAPEHYTATFFAEEGPALCALEERTLETTHAEAGAFLLERLALDSFLADSVRYHHVPLPQLLDAHPLVRFAAWAEQLVHAAALGESERAQLLAAAGLTEPAYREQQSAIERQVERVAASLGIELSGPAARQAATQAIAALATAARERDPLKDSMRDLILVEKTLDALRRHTDPDGCVRAIVKAAVILFDFQDAVVLGQAAGAPTLAPMALPPGRQRLAGLSLPANEHNLAGRVLASGQPAVMTAAEQPSVAEEQWLRFFQAEALVALPVANAAAGPLVLLGATTAAHARHLAERLALLREFGGQAGSLLAAAGDTGTAGAERADTEFLLAARRVAHEVNNPLAIIRNYLTVLQRKAESAQPIRSELGTIEEELDRVTRIIEQFAQPAHVPPGAAACDVNAALKYVARLFSDNAALPAGVQIGRHVSPEPAMAAIDDGSLRQVLVNLAKNAVEAMPNGGRIDLRNNGSVERDGRRYIAIAVSDTGPGLPDTVRARLFQPVASAKTGANRGLGLSIVHDLVRRHGGFIACRSSRGGTVFDILLPAVE